VARTEFIATWVDKEELAQIDNARRGLTRSGFIRRAAVRVALQEITRRERQRRRERSLERLQGLGEQLEVAGA